MQRAYLLLRSEMSHNQGSIKILEALTLMFCVYVDNTIIAIIVACYSLHSVLWPE